MKISIIATSLLDPQRAGPDRMRDPGVKRKNRAMGLFLKQGRRENIVDV
jgi:hypothetical protein